MQQVRPENNLLDRSAGDVTVTFYTDPLCCWSWAMEPAWKQLQSECKGMLRVQYKMGGLLPSWRHFKDTINSISRPSQMGPEWMTAAHLSGVPVNSRIWINDPPSSSYPACIAVKAVQLQSGLMGETYLSLLRKAVMMDGINIARTEILFDLAETLRIRFPDFSVSVFKANLMGDRGKAAFREDLQEVKYLNINRFPTLIIRRKEEPAILLAGYQSYTSLRTALGIENMDREQSD